MIDQKQLEYVECFNYFGSVTNDARCTRGIKSRIAMAKTVCTRKLELNLRKQLVKCYGRSMALYVAESWTFRKVNQKYVVSFEMWCWRRMDKISWTDRVRNEKYYVEYSGEEYPTYNKKKEG
jgi:hypothetical protein